MSDLMDKAGVTTWEARILLVAAVAAIGLVLGTVMAPSIAAMRPLPPPTIETVTVHTDDVLDVGAGCVYTWGGAVYLWAWPDPAPRRGPCPTLQQAQDRWMLALDAPQLMK